MVSPGGPAGGLFARRACQASHSHEDCRGGIGGDGGGVGLDGWICWQASKTFETGLKPT